MDWYAQIDYSAVESGVTLFMNTNKTLLDGIDAYLGYGYGRRNYDCTSSDLEPFLKLTMRHESNFLERQQKAIDIITDIVTQHGKRVLLRYVVRLAKVDRGIRELQPRVRDHVVHALLTFILGIYLNERFLKAEESVDPFQWELAGLFHDIGYPADIAAHLLEPYSKEVNSIDSELDVPTPDVRFEVVPINLDILCNEENSLDLIQQCLDKWGLMIDAREEYDKAIHNLQHNERSIRHGMISALLLLKVIDSLYQKFNPQREYVDKFAARSFDGLRRVNFNQKNFMEKVVPACAAVYIHHLPDECFEKTKVDRSKAPLAFLLNLSDCLQEWERPSADSDGFPASKFDLHIKKVNLVYQAYIPEDKKDEMRKRLESTLIIPDLRIE